jgi:hypothetical protein
MFLDSCFAWICQEWANFEGADEGLVAEDVR